MNTLVAHAIEFHPEFTLHCHFTVVFTQASTLTMATTMTHSTNTTAVNAPAYVKQQKLINWVAEIAALTKPAHIH